MSATTLIVGATSAMAEHAARRLAAEGDTLLLAGRDSAALDILAADLRVRGAEHVEVLPPCDALDPGSIDRLTARLDEREEAIDRVLAAHGHLPDQSVCEESVDTAAEALELNFLSLVRICTPVANQLADQGHGTLAVISSVAGLRGRQSNYLYGAAKGGLNIYLQGLRNRLHPRGVRVVTLLPGFVDTPMTADIDKGPLFVSAETAGACIHKALTRGKADVVYVPRFWRYVMWIIRAIPEPIFKRLKL